MDWNTFYYGMMAGILLCMLAAYLAYRFVEHIADKPIKRKSKKNDGKQKQEERK